MSDRKHFVVSTYIPDVGYRIDLYLGKIDFFNKVESFVCTMENPSMEFPGFVDKKEITLDNAKIVCRALNEFEKNKRKNKTKK